MAYQFEKEAGAKMKVMANAQSALAGKNLNFSGINSTVTSADTICDGMASLLAIASISGDFSNAIRTVSEDVIITD